MRPLSVKSKAALVTTLPGVLLLFAAFAAIEVERVHTEMQRVLGEQQLKLISPIADALDGKIEAAQRALMVTAEVTPAGLFADPAALESRLLEQPGYRSQFDDVFVIGRDGRVLIDLPVLGRRAASTCAIAIISAAPSRPASR